MRRRKLLAALATTGAAATGGCSRIRAFTDLEPTIRVEDVTDAAPHGFSFDVELVSQLDETSPPGLRISVENQSDEPQTFLFREGLPFAEVFPGNTDSHVLLIPEDPDYLFVWGDGSNASLADLEDAPPDERVDGCWRLRHSIFEYYNGSALTFSEDQEIGPAEELSPGESRTGRYSLYSSNNTRDCFRKGSYRFESSNYFGERSPAGFTVQID